MTNNDGLPGLDKSVPFSRHSLSHVFLVINGAGDPYVDHPPWMSSLESSLAHLDRNFTQVASNYAKTHRRQPPTAVFLPVEWHRPAFETWQSQIRQAVPNQTHSGSGTVRDAVAETVGDVLLMASSFWRRTIAKNVLHQIEMQLAAIRRNRPNFSGNVSLIAHSIGAVLALQILDMLSDLSLQAVILTGCPVVAYAALAPDDQRALNVIKEQMDNVRFVNVYHALDPVAFRIEPFMGSDEESGVKVIPKRRSFWDDAGMFWDDVVENLWGTLFKGRAGDLFNDLERREQRQQDREVEGGGVLIDGRLDYELQDGMGVPPLDVMASWGAVKAHTYYWRSGDVARILLDIVTLGEREGAEKGVAT